MKKVIKGFLIAMTVLGGIKFASAGFSEIWQDIHALRWTREGVVRVKEWVNGSGQLEFQVAVSSVAGSSVYISTSNALGLTRLTSAQISQKTPANEGELVWNTTIQAICISTGTNIGGFKISSGPYACQ